MQGDHADILPDSTDTGLLQIRWNRDSIFNRFSSITPLIDLVPYNLAYLPVRIDPGATEDLDVYAVLDRHQKFGLHGGGDQAL